MKSIRESLGGLGNYLFKEAYIYTQMRKGYIPDIYVQSESYFQDYASEIKRRFGQGIEKNDFIAVHVRRGDYVGNTFYVDLFENGYYQRAMAALPGDYLVFSDDIAWCKEQEIFQTCFFSENRNEVEDLNLMASCKGHIIANSSYSWWGAYLSPHEGTVIAPAQWHGDGVERTILPSKWIKV